MAFSGNQLTRLGVSGVPRNLYSSFVAKDSPEDQGTRRRREMASLINTRRKKR